MSHNTTVCVLAVRHARVPRAAQVERQVAAEEKALEKELEAEVRGVQKALKKFAGALTPVSKAAAPN